MKNANNLRESGAFPIGTNASYVENIENVELYEGERRHKQVSFHAKQSQVVLPVA
jgi:hypothetical protein